MKHRAIILSCVSFLVYMALFFCPDCYPQEYEFLHSDVTRYVLANGLTVILKHDNKTPTFSAQVYVRAGSATEERYAGSGITHLIEHMIFKGTSTMSAQEVLLRIKALGAGIDAYTTLDYTAFKMQGAADNIKALLEIFYNIISDPRFDNSELEKEKEVIRIEARYINDNPDKYLSTQFWQRAYVIHPYRDPIIGYNDIFDTIIRDDIVGYYRQFYVPNNMVLVVVGNFDIGSVRQVIGDSFGKLKRRPVAIPSLAREPAQITMRLDAIEYPVSKTSLLIGFHSVSLSEADIFALDTLAVILGTGRSSLLYEALRDRLRLVYAIDACNYTPFHPGLFLIGATLEPDNEEKVIDEIFNVLEGIKKSPIKKKDLDRAKKQVISSYIFGKQTQAGQAADLGVSQLLTGDVDFSDHYVKGVMSVTSEDLAYVANKYIRRQVMTKLSLRPPVRPKNEARDKECPAQPEARKVSMRTLKNGIRLIVAEDKSLPIVSIQACMKAGLYVECVQNNGISNIVSRMLLKGTAGRSQADLFYAIESTGGSLTSYSGNNSIGLSLEVMKEDFKKGVDILSDIILRPAFPKDKLKALKDDILAQISLRDDDIFLRAGKVLKHSLFEGSPYGMDQLGSPESLERITRKDVVNFYREFCAGPNIVIAVCGDVNKDEACSFIESRLRGVNFRTGPDRRKNTLKPLDKKIEISGSMDKEQSVVMAGFRAPGITEPQRYPLQVLSSVFSGPAGRLYNNVRNQQGAAYTIGVFGMTGIDTGSFIFYAASSAQHLDAINESIFAQIEAVNLGDITQEEIDSAKNALLSQYYVELQTAGVFAQKIALDELYGLGFQHYLLYPAIINNIKRDDVIQLSNIYLTPAACVVSKILPEKGRD
ncbi:MAG: pitrilysin family protein [Candidatus Omnitrophota bacterium]